MNTKLNLSLLTIAAVALTSSSALALDGKVYPGSLCLPYSSASGDILERFAQYVKNTAPANSALVMCPITKDIVGGTSLSYIRISYTKVTSTGFYCAIYGRTATGGGTHTSSQWDFDGAGTKNMVLPDIAGYSSGSYSMYCILPPGASLHSYRIDEQ